MWKMEVTFNVNELEGMKRGELQKLCKSVGIKANSKNSQLIEALREYASQNSVKAESSSVSQEKQIQNTLCAEVHVNEVVNKPEAGDKQKDDSDSDSYKKQLMDQLDKKVEEKMPVECKIPRFVQFLNKDSSAVQTNKTPDAKWNKIHQSQFEKMDSIDIYLEKKRKRMEGFNQPLKRAKSTGATRKSQGKPAEVTFKPTVTSLDKSSTFVFGSPVAKPFFQPGNRQTRVTIATAAATSGKKLKLKSPKIFKPIFSGTADNEGKPKTPVARKSFAATTTTGEKRPKTPANPARKSMAVTPFRFLPANIPAAPTPTPKKKFDLQASLAKPLPYKPHTGKLKPISSYKEECKPTISEAKLKSHKIDVKNVKVVSREERRKRGLKNRENKRATTMNRRRGLAC
ncbi:nucleolar and spindle-associated protein 1-like [Orbicella faveolata]|uniref:nucleolar and spindle-associated protein 1-like n=1 Tax=Orbicella faveolata TaxID=48498 RepID=UPI0009E3FDCC|nr:nucleolar and spindle-associated protein 1-like [Orbicella faveolata]